MTGGTLEIRGLATGPAPLTKTVAGSQTIDLVGVHADFDGSAAGTFIPVVQIISAAGNIMAMGLGSTVAAGGSADVTFASFLGGGSGSAVTNAVLKDTGNTMDWLGIQTLGPSGNGLVLKDLGNPGDTGLLIEENGDAGMQLLNAGNGNFFIFGQGNGDLILEQTGNGRLLLQNDGTSPFTILDNATQLELTSMTGPIVLNVTAANLLVALGIPVGSPGVSGAIWKDGAGVLHIDP